MFGGSWGSTLALAYAQRHPERVSELVLRGIFLLRRSELEWFYQNPHGAGSIFPDLWEQYVAPIPAAERGDMMQAYYRRLTSEHAATRAAAARAWATWEGATSYLRTNPQLRGQIRRSRLCRRVRAHRGALLRQPRLLRAATTSCCATSAASATSPAVIVQGRYDMVCPMRSAWDLHRAWPEAELRIVADAGHSAFETGISHELVAATDRYARRTGATVATRRSGATRRR